MLDCAGPTRGGASQIFDAWLDETLTKSDPATREQRPIHWSEAPAARARHPREERLPPLMVVVGGADGTAGARSFRNAIGGKTISAYRFG